MTINKNFVIASALAVFLALPVLSLAVDLTGLPPAGNIESIPITLNKVITLVWQIFVFISIVMFIMAGLAFFLAKGEPAKIAQARSFAIWGVVGVAVAIIGYSAVKIITKILIP